jgi:hypothetical protein
MLHNLTLSWWTSKHLRISATLQRLRVQLRITLAKTFHPGSPSLHVIPKDSFALQIYAACPHRLVVESFFEMGPRHLPFRPPGPLYVPFPFRSFRVDYTSSNTIISRPSLSMRRNIVAPMPLDALSVVVDSCEIGPRHCSLHPPGPSYAPFTVDYTSSNTVVSRPSLSGLHRNIRAPMPLNAFCRRGLQPADKALQPALNHRRCRNETCCSTGGARPPVSPSSCR